MYSPYFYVCFIIMLVELSNIRFLPTWDTVNFNQASPLNALRKREADTDTRLAANAKLWGCATAQSLTATC